MEKSYKNHSIPSSRLATFDVFAIGLAKHHVVALLEMDVTHARKQLQQLRRSGRKVSFNGWLVASIAHTVAQHPQVAAFRKGKRRLVVFEDIHVSMLVERDLHGQKVPLPMVVRRAQLKSPEVISAEIDQAKSYSQPQKVLGKEAAWHERLYDLLPGFLRRMVWRFMLASPHFAHRQMGNVVVSALGATASINGWFIHRSVHPLSLGIGSVISKAVVVDGEVQIRQMLNLTLLLDHEAVDGAPMARFVKQLTQCIEKAELLQE